MQNLNGVLKWVLPKATQQKIRRAMREGISRVFGKVCIHPYALMHLCPVRHTRALGALLWLSRRSSINSIAPFAC